MGIARSRAIGYMRAAFRKGQSATDFRQAMREKGISYRWTTMLADWRSVNEIEVKAERFKYVRKDYYPTQTALAEVSWKLSHEYMYVVTVKSRLEVGVPVTDRRVNIVSDEPMTPRMIEQAVTEKWAEWEDYTAEQLGEMVMYAAIHRTIE